MQLTKISKQHLKQVKAIYMEAFPKKERKPFFTLKSKKVQIYTAIENDDVLGFTAVIPLEHMVMVDYLAVNSKIRSKGTGSFIMQELCKIYQDKKIVLLIEKLDENAENQTQRIARRRFYIKNGFSSSGLFVSGVSGIMEIMNYGGRIQANEYIRLQKYALGPFMFKLSKMKLV